MFLFWGLVILEVGGWEAWVIVSLFPNSAWNKTVFHYRSNLVYSGFMRKQLAVRISSLLATCQINHEHAPALFCRIKTKSKLSCEINQRDCCESREANSGATPDLKSSYLKHQQRGFFTGGRAKARKIWVIVLRTNQGEQLDQKMVQRFSTLKTSQYLMD